jgi:hypothetical protein
MLSFGSIFYIFVCLHLLIEKEDVLSPRLGYLVGVCMGTAIMFLCSSSLTHRRVCEIPEPKVECSSHSISKEVDTLQVSVVYYMTPEVRKKLGGPICDHIFERSKRRSDGEACGKPSVYLHLEGCLMQTYCSRHLHSVGKVREKYLKRDSVPVPKSILESID